MSLMSSIMCLRLHRRLQTQTQQQLQLLQRFSIQCSYRKPKIWPNHQQPQHHHQYDDNIIVVGKQYSCQSQAQHHHQYQQNQQRRYMGVYAVGEGWTGALGKENVLSTISGHFDEEPSDVPVLIYPTSSPPPSSDSLTTNNIKQVVAGWGCSIILDEQGQIYTVGRPQDLMSLFRLRRMPKSMRNWISSHDDPIDTTIIGTAISKLIGMASGDTNEQPWDIAKQYSYLHDWTKMNYQGTTTTKPMDRNETKSSSTKGIGDTKMSKIVAGPGFMAMIGTSGALYTLGINNRGQCGIGSFSNNVWTPQPVMGITNEKHQNDKDLIQDQPVAQVALGFQHGYALTQSGQIYSWGKTQRGQLGREIEIDQDPTARKIIIHELENKHVTQISSGHHFGTALTTDNEIYIWGKNMKYQTIDDNDDGDDDDDDDDSKQQHRPEDVTKPEYLHGLPSNLQIVQISSGSHHTAILMEDGSIYAIGVASDEPTPLLKPVLIVEPGILDLPLKQFEAHHDRTTIIDNSGNIFQVHLWKDKQLQEYSLFTPSYIDPLIDQGETIQSIHRGWRHTLIVTTPSN